MKEKAPLFDLLLGSRIGFVSHTHLQILKQELKLEDNVLQWTKDSLYHQGYVGR